MCGSSTVIRESPLNPSPHLLRSALLILCSTCSRPAGARDVAHAAGTSGRVRERAPWAVVMTESSASCCVDIYSEITESRTHDRQLWPCKGRTNHSLLLQACKTHSAALAASHTRTLNLKQLTTCKIGMRCIDCSCTSCRQRHGHVPGQRERPAVRHDRLRNRRNTSHTQCRSRLESRHQCSPLHVRWTISSTI